ncbi:MAG: hypothetical protein ACYTEQ_22950 [Planctomycetota bacterium]|jgi:hypothetical protein
MQPHQHSRAARTETIAGADVEDAIREERSCLALEPCHEEALRALKVLTEQ